jgi:hypothetical protein
MKKNYLLAILALLMVSSFAQAQTNNETRSLSNFSSIKISNSIEAELIKGDQNKIDIVASGIELDKVETNVSDNALEVKLARGNFKSNSVKVTITYTELNEVQASTSAKVFVQDPLENDDVYLFATTSAYLEVSVNAETLHAEATTSAKIAVSGTANELNLRIFTSAEVEGTKLQVQNAQVQANTAARSEFKVSNSIKGSASTGARITFVGDPQIIDVSTNTGGSIKVK